MMKYEYIVSSQDQNKRLDLFLSEHIDDFSRTQISKFIKNQFIFVNQKMAKANTRLNTGDQISFEYHKEKFEIIPQKYPLEILYEDEYLAFINKPIHLPVHPDKHHQEDTLVNYLVAHFGIEHLSSMGEDFRPGIIHRLDQDTSGVMVILKSNLIYEDMVNLFQNHQLIREYCAIAQGHFHSNEGIINEPIGRHPKAKIKMAVTSQGKIAKTAYQVLEEGRYTSWVKCRLYTGRTHQIRVHLSHIGHPIIGDEVYGSHQVNQKYQQHYPLLHAQRLAFEHPIRKEYLDIQAPYPKIFEDKFKLMKER